MSRFSLSRVCLLTLLALLVASTASAASPRLSRHRRDTSPVPPIPASADAESPAASAPVPFLLLMVEPELPTPGGNVELQWQCSWCDSLRNYHVVISVNTSVIIARSLPINGSLVYTIPAAANLSLPQQFTASVEQAQPPLSYSLQVPLRPNKQEFGLVEPSGTRYAVGDPLPLAWKCVECYQLSSVWLYSTTEGYNTQPLLQSPVPLADSYFSIPMPSRFSGTGNLVITMMADNRSTIASQSPTITVYGQYAPPPPPRAVPVPFLLLFVEPQTAPPGGEATLSWFCFYCESLVTSGASVALSTNHSVVLLSSAALNGSLNYTVPTSYAVLDTLGFTASITGPNTTVINYSCLLPLRAPVPTLKLVRPAASSTVYQSSQMTLEFTCVECYLLPTVSVSWTPQSRSGGGTLVHGLPVGDSGITIQVPDEMVTAHTVFIDITADLQPSVSDENFVYVDS
jgi:hypothetical protein